MCAHGVLDGQRVHPENVRHFLHLVVVRFAQADPDERIVPEHFDLAHFVQGRGVAEFPGQPVAFGVDGAVDQRLVGGVRLRIGALFARLVRERPKRFGQCVKTLEHIHLRSLRRSDRAVLHATRPGGPKRDDPVAGQKPR